MGHGALLLVLALNLNKYATTTTKTPDFVHEQASYHSELLVEMDHYWTNASGSS